jgi:hypothetical protein
MADNVAITAGSGTSIAADEIVDGTLGTVKVQYVKLMDGTLDGTSKASVSAAGLKVDLGGGSLTATGGALDINVKSGGNPNGAAVAASSAPVVPATDWVGSTALSKFSTGYYVTVAASQTATVLQSSTGATGDYISGILVIPATTSPGNVLLLDNATSITVFTGGATSVSNLVPFFIPVGGVSRSGAWKLTTGANVSCVAIGKFS